MVVIGITGSIGMGKTTVSNMLEILKIPVFDSDKKVKEILEKNQNVRKKYQKFGLTQYQLIIIKKKLIK